MHPRRVGDGGASLWGFGFPHIAGAPPGVGEACMAYRYQMVWFNDPSAPHGAGRPFFGHISIQAIAHAEQLWREGTYAGAIGYRDVDTEDGEVLV